MPRSSTMTMAELVGLHRGAPYLLERNALLMAPHPMRQRRPIARPRWRAAMGALRRAAAQHDLGRGRRTPRSPTSSTTDITSPCSIAIRTAAASSASNCSFGFMEEPNVERYLADMARHKEIYGQGGAR